MWDGENQFLQLHTSWAQRALFVFQAAGFMTVHWCSDWGCWDRRMSIHENGFERDTWGLRKRSERESGVQATLWIQWEREKRLFLTPGHSLWVGAVPSLQRSQPGSEQPKLTAERCMQQNKTSTWSRQNHRKAGGPPWHFLSCSSDIYKEARVVLSFTFLFFKD